MLVIVRTVFTEMFMVPFHNFIPPGTLPFLKITIRCLNALELFSLFINYRVPHHSAPKTLFQK